MPFPPKAEVIQNLKEKAAKLLALATELEENPSDTANHRMEFFYLLPELHAKHLKPQGYNANAIRTRDDAREFIQFPDNDQFPLGVACERIDATNIRQGKDYLVLTRETPKDKWESFILRAARNEDGSIHFTDGRAGIDYDYKTCAIYEAPALISEES